MARTPIADRPLVAQWLIRARASQGDAYTAQRFLEELRAETGSAPDRATYAQWESGAVTPKEASLAPVLAFWAARGIEGPTEAKPVLSLEERAVLAAEAQASALRDLANAQVEANWVITARLDAMEALIATLTAPTTADPLALEAMRAWGRDALGRSRQRAQRPEPLRVTE